MDRILNLNELLEKCCGKYALVLKIFVIDFETKTFIQVQFSGNIVYSET